MDLRAPGDAIIAPYRHLPWRHTMLRIASKCTHLGNPIAMPTNTSREAQHRAAQDAPAHLSLATLGPRPIHRALRDLYSGCANRIDEAHFRGALALFRAHHRDCLARPQAPLPIATCAHRPATCAHRPAQLSQPLLQRLPQPPPPQPGGGGTAICDGIALLRTEPKLQVIPPPTHLTGSDFSLTTPLVQFALTYKHA